MKMKNSEWLLKQNPCDLLKQINKITGDDELCIMDAFMPKDKSIDRCNHYAGNCDNCIESWMNKENQS